MEITDVETHLVQSDTPISEYGVTGWLLVRITTDEGIVGVGEAGTWAFLEAAEGAVNSFERYLIGKDPLRREHHWQYMYRNAHFRGAAVMGAISAIDIALWDIAGKHLGEPVYELLGGSTRQKVRTYVHVLGETTEELLDGIEAAREQGFTAVGHLSPLLDESREEPYFETHAGMLADAEERVRRFREAAGTEVDLCIEIHRRLDPDEAIALANRIEQYDPMFYEDPVRPSNFDAMATVAESVDVPIATGERLHTVEEFEMLLRRDAVDYVRPDVCLAGGITHTKKIAGLAEANYVDVVPHNPLSPISTAACVQLSAAIPNLGIMEFPYRPEVGRAPNEAFVEDPLEYEDGFLEVPDRPGIGVELNDEVFERDEYVPRDVTTRLHEDGSVVDQ